MANNYYFTVTVASAHVATTITDFEIGFNLASLTSLIGEHGYWTHGKSDGGDLRVYSDAAMTTRLPLEVVWVDTSNKEGYIFFKGDISSSANKVYYVAYGDSSLTQPAATDTYGRNAVWSRFGSSGFVLHNPYTGTDSTGNTSGWGTTGTVSNNTSNDAIGLGSSASIGSGTSGVYTTNATAQAAMESQNDFILAVHKRISDFNRIAGQDDFICGPEEASDIAGTYLHFAGGGPDNSRYRIYAQSSRSINVTSFTETDWHLYIAGIRDNVSNGFFHYIYTTSASLAASSETTFNADTIDATGTRISIGCTVGGLANLQASEGYYQEIRAVGSSSTSIPEQTYAGEVAKNFFNSSWITASAEQSSGSEATGAGTVSAITAAGAGATATTATGAGTVSDITAAGEAIAGTTATATGSGTIAVITATGAGATATAATGAGTTSEITATGAGATATAATGAGTLVSIAADGLGGTGFFGTGAGNIDAITAAGSGAAATIVTGAGTVSDITAAGVGATATAATGAGTVSDITAAGVGATATAATGAGTVSDITAAGEAIAGTTATATGSGTIAVITATGAGATATTATGAGTTSELTAQGSEGLSTATGAGTIAPITAKAFDVYTPRGLSPDDQSVLTAVVTTPTLLIDWELTSRILYFSTRATLDNNGHTYTGGRAIVDSLSVDSLGGGQAQITLLNHDQAMSALVLNEDVAGTAITIFYLTADDRVMVFKGQVSGVDIGYQAVILGCLTQDQRTLTVPKVIYAPPLFNNIPAPGTELIKGNSASAVASRAAVQNAARSERRKSRLRAGVAVYSRRVRRG